MATSIYLRVAGDIVRWMDEWLSDREHGGFYASQDADINLDDDGDYFTWTVDEAKAVLSPDEFQAIALHYDIGEARRDAPQPGEERALGAACWRMKSPARWGATSPTFSTCSPSPAPS